MGNQINTESVECLLEEILQEAQERGWVRYEIYFQKRVFRIDEEGPRWRPMLGSTAEDNPEMQKEYLRAVLDEIKHGSPEQTEELRQMLRGKGGGKYIPKQVRENIEELMDNLVENAPDDGVGIYEAASALVKYALDTPQNYNTFYVDANQTLTFDHYAMAWVKFDSNGLRLGARGDGSDRSVVSGISEVVLTKEGIELLVGVGDAEDQNTTYQRLENALRESINDFGDYGHREKMLSIKYGPLEE